MIDLHQLDELVETIVIVMMENRSFDHMLGHLSYQKDGNRDKVEGLRDPLDSYVNIGGDGKMYGPFLTQDTPLDGDLPHERDAVETQLAYVNGVPTMTGFIKAYIDDYQAKGKTPPSPTDPMKFLKSSSVPVTNFLANNFAVCDHWFAPIPTSTHPNRCMAFGGSTPIENSHNLDSGLKIEYLVLDWLDDHGIKWRVYHHGALSCFYMFGLRFSHDSRFY